MPGPSSDRLIRVDMTHQTVKIDAFPDAWKLLGGRGLSARILIEECDAKCDPLGPGNVLVMAPGVISGTAAPTSGRISIGGKSPLTGGIKEANAGGNPGQDLMKLGYRAVIVTGQPVDADKRYHAALIKLHLGDAAGARALGDSILALDSTHLLGFVARGMAFRWERDTVQLRPVYAAFRQHAPAELARGRPEYTEHQLILREFQQAAEGRPTPPRTPG